MTEYTSIPLEANTQEPWRPLFVLSDFDYFATKAREINASVKPVEIQEQERVAASQFLDRFRFEGEENEEPIAIDPSTPLNQITCFQLISWRESTLREILIEKRKAALPLDSAIQPESIKEEVDKMSIVELIQQEDFGDILNCAIIQSRREDLIQKLFAEIGTYIYLRKEGILSTFAGIFREELFKSVEDVGEFVEIVELQIQDEVVLSKIAESCYLSPSNPPKEATVGLTHFEYIRQIGEGSRIETFRLIAQYLRHSSEINPDNPDDPIKTTLKRLGIEAEPGMIEKIRTGNLNDMDLVRFIGLYLTSMNYSHFRD